jgi:hypothetical protein
MADPRNSLKVPLPKRLCVEKSAFSSTTFLLIIKNPGAICFSEKKVPVTIITGQLGAGKTTLLTYILQAGVLRPHPTF